MAQIFPLNSIHAIPLHCFQPSDRPTTAQGNETKQSSPSGYPVDIVKQWSDADCTLVLSSDKRIKM